MSVEKLFDGITQVSDDLVKQAEQPCVPRRRKKNWTEKCTIGRWNTWRNMDTNSTKFLTLRSKADRADTTVFTGRRKNIWAWALVLILI